ncbi:MAG: hypothetical protein DHS20C14_19490 [Phycisphaeraceae bacterium]|nr:MAG: hypothetical protein DHS20C14_19490 [Phycisphaeraceae bacterium]
MSVEGVCPECGSRIWNPNQTPTSGAAIASLVLGCVAILSCVGFGPVSLLFGIPAVICGEIAARQVKRGERGNASAGLALAGRIMGWVGIVVGLVGVVVLIIMLLNP